MIPTPNLDKRLAAATEERPDGVANFCKWLVEERRWKPCFLVEPRSLLTNTVTYQPVPDGLIANLLRPLAGPANSTHIGEFLDALADGGITICRWSEGNYDAIRGRLVAEKRPQRSWEWALIDPTTAPDYEARGWFPVPDAHNPQRLLEAYFGIDAAACDRELRDLLERQRALNDALAS